MGVVYLAERADDAYRQRVAIKLVRIAADGIVERFQRERQILANLEHPNIARLLDGGTTAAGLPYLVMEYVDGEPIDTYCERHELDVEQRLKLFLSVCAAVRFAHQNLVVHRDLKPSNILVTADGQPKLLDFGIARLVENEGAQDDATQTIGRMMTPQYASPEQLRGGQVTTASDVYSLGVLLYQLLTGIRPYGVDVDSLGEMERIVCEEVPSAPSKMVPGPEGSLLRGDLDWITLKALEKEPGRRYGSPFLLAEDIERHLRHEPVVARPPSARYRIGRYVRRHRLGVLAASVVVLALVAGALLAGVGFVQATRDRKLAERDAASSREVTAFLQEMLSSVKPDNARGHEVTVREVLDEAATRLEGRFDENPEVEAALRFTVGDSYQALGEFETALPLLEKAVEIRRRELGDDDPRFMDTLDRLGMVYWLTGDFQRSLRCSEEMLVIRERISGRDSLEYTQILGNIANTHADMGDLTKAEDLLRRALAVERELLIGEDREDLSYTINNLATVLADQERFDEAIELHRESLAIRRETIGDDSPAVVISLMNLGFALHGAGRESEAEEVLGQAIEIGDVIFGPEHLRVASARMTLASVFAAMGRLDEAEAMCRRVLDELSRGSGERSWRAGGAHGVLGEILIDQGRVDEGKAELRAGLEILNETLGESHPRTVTVREALDGAELD